MSLKLRSLLVRCISWDTLKRVIFTVLARCLLVYQIKTKNLKLPIFIWAHCLKDPLNFMSLANQTGHARNFNHCWKSKISNEGSLVKRILYYWLLPVLLASSQIYAEESQPNVVFKANTKIAELHESIQSRITPFEESLHTLKSACESFREIIKAEYEGEVTKLGKHLNDLAKIARSKPEIRIRLNEVSQLKDAVAKTPITDGFKARDKAYDRYKDKSLETIAYLLADNEVKAFLEKSKSEGITITGSQKPGQIHLKLKSNGSVAFVELQANLDDGETYVKTYRDFDEMCFSDPYLFEAMPKLCNFASNMSVTHIPGQFVAIEKEFLSTLGISKASPSDRFDGLRLLSPLRAGAKHHD